MSRLLGSHAGRTPLSTNPALLCTDHISVITGNSFCGSHCFSQGADHIFVITDDQSRCGYPQELLKNAIFIQHYGRVGPWQYRQCRQYKSCSFCAKRWVLVCAPRPAARPLAPLPPTCLHAPACWLRSPMAFVIAAHQPRQHLALDAHLNMRMLSRPGLLAHSCSQLINRGGIWSCDIDRVWGAQCDDAMVMGEAVLYKRDVGSCYLPNQVCAPD